MKTIKFQLIIKTLLILYLFGSTYANKTSFGLLKKAHKKTSASTNSQNHFKSSNKNEDDTNAGTAENKASDTAQATQSETGNAGLVDPAAMNLDSKNQKIQPTLPDKPTYYQGWIKYLHYSDADKQKQLTKNFWKNTFFEREKIIATNPNQPASDEVIILKFNFLYILIIYHISHLHGVVNFMRLYKYFNLGNNFKRRIIYFL